MHEDLVTRLGVPILVGSKKHYVKVIFPNYYSIEFTKDQVEELQKFLDFAGIPLSAGKLFSRESVDRVWCRCGSSWPSVICKDCV